ncbi:MAG: BMC domain-containing protein [Synergistales bacterium]|nr:BMC domain-containing protein [Synergistales bacterium]
MAMNCHLIVKPTAACRRIIERRMASRWDETMEKASWGAVLLVQGPVAEILAAVDVATKAASVSAGEIVGNCPQQINTVAFVGAVADVKLALAALREWGDVR